MKQLVSKAVGIDLGTTNSAVAVMNPTDRDIVIHRDPNTKSATTPSCVWRREGVPEPIVGRRAYSRKGGRPEPVSSIKRLMGTRATMDLGGEKLNPQQISALILAEMKRQIETDVAAFDSPSSRWIVDRAVVTVPAYFDQPQIDATREAAELAGLEVLSLLHEPTAAASYHCWRTATRDGTFLVYDLGGGTFDVSILRCTAGSFEVLGISGNNRLGGDDIDAALARHLQTVLQADGWALDLDPERDEEDRARFARLRAMAEGAKKALSDNHEYMVRDSGLLIDKAGEPVVVETMLERTELEEIARPFIERTFLHCDEAIARAEERAGVGLADVDAVILAGGSTHMPLVRELVTRELCGNPTPDGARRDRAKCAEPVYEKVDTVVALGAAVRAAAVGGLVVRDEQRTVRVNLRGVGNTSASRLSVGGTVEALSPEVDLRGGRVLLTAGDYEDEADLTDEGAFAFTRIPVQPDTETEFSFAVHDCAGVERVVASRPLAYNAEAAKPLGGSASGAQNTKAITIEVRKDSETSQFPLVDVLQTLPFAKDYDFRHPGEVENVELRLFQEGRPIQMVDVRVPRATPKDTPIRMHVVMHENYAITVEGTIGDTPYQATVQLPTDRDMPTSEAATDLTRRFQEGLAVLSVGQRATASAQLKVSQHAFNEARERGDVDQATHEFDQMRRLVDALSKGQGELRPPKAEFDKLVEDCRERHAHYLRDGVPDGRSFDASDVSQTIEEYRRSGERAYTNRDQRAYGEAVQRFNDLLDYLRGLQQAPTGRPVASPTERAETLVTRIRETAQQLAYIAQGHGDTQAEREIAGIEERIAELDSKIAKNPYDVIDESIKLRVRLSQVQAGFARQSAAGTGIPEL
ncbi:Hsp70 family protein [Streptomyces noursei]|uniref:Hsp70 family protein n=1 Tax=Streptomyces noursei TaxID=1971 RepID=UPI003830DF9A